MLNKGGHLVRPPEVKTPSIIMMLEQNDHNQIVSRKAFNIDLELVVLIV